MGEETNKKSSSVYAMRHSCSHILASAVQKLWPEAKFGVGPAVDDGFYYDIDLGGETISEDNLIKIEKEMGKIIKDDQKFEKKEVGIDEAINWAKKSKQPYKQELLNDLKRSGTTEVKNLDAKELGLEAKSSTKVDEVSFYTNGEFTDLCQGPHVGSTSRVGKFKLLKVAGAYWRGSESNPQMQRVYGIAFATEKELINHLELLEEAKKRDHRKLGENLKLFTQSKEVGPGLILWMPNGTAIKEEIEKLGKEVEAKQGYQRVSTPHIAKEEIFRTSGHLPYFKDEMYPPMKLEGENYYLKPMNCPHTHMIYKAEQHSYRDLPLRYAEFGAVYRYEDSGALMGLMRVRGMTQNDAHIYCTEEQALEEIISVIDMHKYYYDLFNISDYYVELALPDIDNKPNKYFDDVDGWNKAVDILHKAAKKADIKVVEKEGEAAFYGPKFDFNIKSAIGREFGASTNQLDFGSGERFALEYIGKDGKEKKIPYIIHRAPLGSDERFIGFLIEHYGGAFPLWLAPEQVRIITVNQKGRTVKFAEAILQKARDLGIRAELDNTGESVGKKIRNSELMKVPCTVVIGDREIKTGRVIPRVRRDIVVSERGQPIGFNEFFGTLVNEIKSRTAKTSVFSHPHSKS